MQACCRYRDLRKSLCFQGTNILVTGRFLPLVISVALVWLFNFCKLQVSWMWNELTALSFPLVILRMKSPNPFKECVMWENLSICAIHHSDLLYRCLSHLYIIILFYSQTVSSLVSGFSWIPNFTTTVYCPFELDLALLCCYSEQSAVAFGCKTWWKEFLRDMERLVF